MIGLFMVIKLGSFIENLYHIGVDCVTCSVNHTLSFLLLLFQSNLIVFHFSIDYVLEYIQTTEQFFNLFDAELFLIKLKYFVEVHEKVLMGCVFFFFESLLTNLRSFNYLVDHITKKRLVLAVYKLVLEHLRNKSNLQRFLVRILVRIFRKVSILIEQRIGVLNLYLEPGSYYILIRTKLVNSY